MDPFSYIFDAASQLTGGIITDLKTGFLAMLVITFILMGLDLVKGVLDNFFGDIGHRKNMKLTQNLRSQRDMFDQDSFDYEFFDKAYKKSLNKSLDSFNTRNYR
jgi:hypothetical protein